MHARQHKNSTSGADPRSTKGAIDIVAERISAISRHGGSIVGTRRDLDEAIAFAADDKVRTEVTRAPLEDINAIFANVKAGKVSGRMVLDMAMA